MTTTSRTSRLRRATFAVLAAALGGGAVLVGAPATAQAADYATITGSGSSWAANAVSDWVSNGAKFGWQVNYTANGSTTGRNEFLTNQVDFAVSDIPFQFDPTDGSKPERPTAGSYAYMPIVAGGTAFMYNLKIGGKQVTNLRLSGENIARIFTGQVKTWNDPSIAADNPGLTLPGTTVVPVVRADGSGSSAQFSLWMDNQYPALWKATYAPGGETSIWPQLPGGIRKNGDDGVSQYVQSSYGDGAIGYVQYSYAKNAGFPVAKMLNKAGYYVEPTPQNVAVALLKAEIDDDASNPATYLTQQLPGVYNDGDKRTYPLSAYSYLILPLTQGPRFAAAKAATLGAFGKYLLCDGQDSMDRLGYSPLPINLVTAAFAQLGKSPGVNVGDLQIASCKNPTFSPDGTNKLATTAPFPAECDKQGPTQCSNGTGGAPQSTTVKPAASGGGATGAAAGAAAAGTATDPAAVASVDPETGLAAGGTANGAAVPLAGPVSLNRQGGGSGWSGSQTFAVLAGLFLLMVFVLPPVLVKRLSKDGGA